MRNTREVHYCGDCAGVVGCNEVLHAGGRPYHPECLHIERMRRLRNKILSYGLIFLVGLGLGLLF